MGNLLSTAKQVLIDGAIELYEMRRSELDLDILSYENHYRNLGSLIFQIDCYESLGDILNDMEKDNLQELGYFGADDFMIEEFLKAVKENS
tara:strand:- start:299 stop:571 length:273 start_codon:yes stop_codon:yes gene_type:complete